jgi:hypothetical protein
MPPFQSKSTGARSSARISSSGARDTSSIWSKTRTWGEHGMDFAVRRWTPPPTEINVGS